MDVPALKSQHGWVGPTRLALGIIVLSLSVPHTWTREYTTANTPITTGPCRDKLPCKADNKQGDPGDCAVYYECSPARDQLILRQCPPLTHFDRKQKACLEGEGVKCTRPCKKRTDKVPEDNVGPAAETPAPSAPEMKPKAENNASGAANESGAEKPPGVVDNDGAGAEAPPANGTTESVLPATTPTPAPPDAGKPAETTAAVTAAPPPPAQNPSTAPTKAQSTKTQPPVTTTTAAESTASTTTQKRDTTPAVTEPPPTPSPRPPYVIVTEGPGMEGTTQGNSSVIAPGDQAQAGLSTATIGIIAGVVGGLILLAVLVLIIILLIRRRKRMKNSKIIRMENPEYVRTHPAREQNFRFSRDSTLYVGPTVNLHNNYNGNRQGHALAVMNNNSPASDRKKRLAPPPPPESTGSASPNSTLNRSKRQAPPPPNPFGQHETDDDLFEKDSHGSSVELTTFTARNQHASITDVRDEEETPIEEAAAVTQPLVTRNDEHAGPDPRYSSAEDEEVESPPTHPEQSLLTTKYSRSKDNMSVDSYDIDKNPFFEG